MKRYRDCTILCNKNQNAEQLMQEVETTSISKGYKVERTSSLVNNDALLVTIKIKGLPASTIVLGVYSEGKGVSILNIVPLTESGVSHIDIETYNKILDIFKDDVFQEIHNRHYNSIETNKEDYTIQEIIPKSFDKLNQWLNGYPLSSHQFDTNRWYDFVIALHKSGESLPLDTLENYVKERCRWKEEDITKMELRLESHLDLLEYYDLNR